MSEHLHDCLFMLLEDLVAQKGETMYQQIGEMSLVLDLTGNLRLTQTGHLLSRLVAAGTSPLEAVVTEVVQQQVVVDGLLVAPTLRA